jgi:tetratricopeptide (TPR) repeat protein
MKDLAATGRWDRVDHYGLKATSIWGASAEAYHGWAIALFQLGENYDAFKKLETSTRLDPGMLASHRILADIHKENGRPSMAIPHLRAILKRLPDDADALHSLGTLLTDTDKPEEGLPLLRRAYQLHPETPAVIDSYAWALFQSGRRDLAQKVVRDGKGYFKDSELFTARRTRILSP